jgi:AraC-like DNA-binding protein
MWDGYFNINRWESIMNEYFNLNRKDDAELDMCHCGVEDCAPGHGYGPAVRDHYLIHYIREGKGIFRVGETLYRLTKGDGFLICPGIVTYYQADWEEPWRYSWVGFHGFRADSYLKDANLSALSPVFRYRNDDFLTECLQAMVAAKFRGRGRELFLKARLYLFMAKLIENSADGIPNQYECSKQEMYVRNAVEYIRMNYSRKITVTQIARFVGLDRSYLCALFKASLGIGPQQFFIRYKVDRACELMRNPALSLGDISRSVGYEDPLQFSKVFRRVKNQSARDFRKSLPRE